MTITAIVLLLLAGGFSAWSQRRLQGQVASLQADARKRMRTVFPAIMAIILVVFFIALYVMRLHA